MKGKNTKDSTKRIRKNKKNLELQKSGKHRLSTSSLYANVLCESRLFHCKQSRFDRQLEKSILQRIFSCEIEKKIENVDG